MTTLDAGLGVRAFFTTRDGGVSDDPYASLNLSYSVGDDPEAVAENRRIVETRSGAPIAYMSQVHGATAATIADVGDAPEADALITATPGIALAVAVADCVPILAHDRVSGAVAAIHAGRRGVVSGVVDAAIRSLVAIAGDDASIEASIGPAICGDCYEVPEQMRQDVAAVAPEAWSETSWGTPSLDLVLAVVAQLKAAGVTDIVRAGACTRESPEYYSHRRDGVTGRFAGIVVCGPHR